VPPPEGKLTFRVLTYLGALNPPALPSQFPRPSLVRCTGGRGALLAFRAFEKPGPVFRPTPSAPDPQTIQDARDANKWRAAMNIEIENMHHFCVFTAVPRPLSATTITPRWVFHWNIENGSLVKRKARLVERGFAQVFGVDYQEAHLYAPVMRLEPSFEFLPRSPRYPT